jgi:signal transduction histidine kinase
VTQHDANPVPLTLSAEQWLALTRAILSDDTSVTWLTNAAADILTRLHCHSSLNSVAERFPSRLSVISGPDVRIDLTQMVAQCVAESRTIFLPSLELSLTSEVTAFVDISVRPITLPDLPAMAFVRLTIDSDHAELALQRSRQQGLDSLTELAAKIAHELNNPLDGSMRYVGLALRRLEHVEDQSGVVKIEEYLSSARAALTKMHGILSDLVKFARTGQGEIEQISINELIEQAVQTMVARAQVQKINIHTDLSASLPAVGTPRLYQVFCNLIRNALDAIDERRRRHSGAAAEVTIRSQLSSGAIEISVEDTGIGFAESPEKLFEPFYTTKADHRAEHADGGGARFVVTLPSGQSQTPARPATRYDTMRATTGEGAKR